MNEKPLPFVILENDKVKLNEEVLEKIKMAKNPRLLLFYGTTRQGKSTTLNQLIKGNNDTWKFINKSPFLSRTSEERVTEGCDIFGPIRYNELVRRHNSGRDIQKKIKKEEKEFRKSIKKKKKINFQKRKKSRHKHENFKRIRFL